MVAFKNDTATIQQQIGRIHNSEELAEAIRSGAVESITPRDHWLVAWKNSQTVEIEALEFAPIAWCKERWPESTRDLEGRTLTLEVHEKDDQTFVNVNVHPPKDSQ